MMIYLFMYKKYKLWNKLYLFDWDIYNFREGGTPKTEEIKSWLLLVTCTTCVVFFCVWLC